MADIKRTTEGLEHCLSRYVDGLCDDCPYMGEIDKSYMIPMKCKEIIMRDALELLKAQQPIRPTSYCVLDKNGRTSLRWKCGRCGRLIKYNKGVIKGKDYESIDFYCGNCGTPILWNNKNCSF